MSLHLRIKIARKLADLTQVEVAKHFGISRPAVTQWEAEAGTRPDGNKVAGIASLCSVSLDWLLKGEGQAREISELQNDLLALIPDSTEMTTKGLKSALETLEKAIEENALEQEDLRIVTTIIESARARKRARAIKNTR